MKQCPPAPLSPQLQENTVTVDSHTAGSKSASTAWMQFMAMNIQLKKALKLSLVSNDLSRLGKGSFVL